MASDRSYVALNDAERKRLEGLVARCSDADLERAMPAGWTVAATLAHLAFWDERVRVLFERWEREGSAPPPEDAGSVDWINDSAKPLISALEPRVAARVTVDAAEAADRAVAGLSDELYARNGALGLLVNPDRADHRLEHLDEIELILSR